MKNWSEEEILADLARQEALIASGKMKFISFEDELRDMDRQVEKLEKSRRSKTMQEAGHGQKLASAKI